MSNRPAFVLLGLAGAAILVIASAIRGENAARARIPDVVPVPSERRGAVVRGPAFDPALRLVPRSGTRASLRIDGRAIRVERTVDLGARIVATTALVDGGLAVVTEAPSVVRLDRAFAIVATTQLPAPSVTASVERGADLVLGTESGTLFRVDSRGTIVARVVIEPGRAIDTLVSDGASMLLTCGHRLVRVDDAFHVTDAVDLGARAVGAPVLDAAGNVALGTRAETLVLFAPTLDVRFTYEGRADVDARATITSSGFVAFASMDRRVVAIDGQGAIRFEVDVATPVRAPVVSREGTIVVSTLGPVPRVLGLRDDGSLAFRFAAPFTDDVAEGFRAAPSLVDGGLLVGGVDDAIHVVDRHGRERARLATRGDVDVDPAVLADGRIVFGSADGRLRVLR